MAEFNIGDRVEAHFLLREWRKGVIVAMKPFITCSGEHSISYCVRGHTWMMDGLERCDLKHLSDW